MVLMCAAIITFPVFQAGEIKEHCDITYIPDDQQGHDDSGAEAPAPEREDHYWEDYNYMPPAGGMEEDWEM